MDIDREPYQKIVLCILAAMTVFFAVWTAVSRTNDGVLFHDELLEVTPQGDTTVYSGTLSNTAVTITHRKDNDGTDLVNFSADGRYYAQCRVEHPKGTIKTEFGEEVERIRIIRNDEVLFSGGYDPDPTVNSFIHYYNEDGTFTMSPSVSIQAVTNDPWTNFEFDISDIRSFADGPKTCARGSWPFFFLGLFVTLIGAVMVAFPDHIFFLRYSWIVRSPIPTDFTLFCHKVASVLYIGLSLWAYLIGINKFVYV